MEHSDVRGKRPSGGLALMADGIFAVCVAFSLTLDLNLLSWNNYHNWFTASPTTPVVTVLFAMAFAVLRWARGHLPGLGWGSGALSLFLGAWWVMTCSVQHTQDINQPFLTNGQILKAFTIMVGMAVLYDLLFRLMACALEGRWDLDAQRLRRSRLMAVYRAHTTLLCAGALLLVWLPYIVCIYPCATNSDTSTQIRMVMGLSSFNENHPILNTALIELFVRLGQLLNSAQAGLFLYVLAQAGFAALVLGYSQRIMRQMNAPRWLRAGALLVCALMPVYVCNIPVILKDVPYSYAALLLLCEAVRGLFLEEEGYTRKPGFVLRWMVAAMLLLSMRNNGMGILLPVVLAWVIRAVKRRDVRLALRMAALLLVPVLLISGMKTLYRSGKETHSVDIAGGMSLLLQQTGRFVTTHDVPPEERAVLEEVFDYDGIRYDPFLADPMKRVFHNDASPEAIRRYLGVWAKQLVRDPICYAKATLIQNALLFDPQTYNLAIFMRPDLRGGLDEALDMTGARWNRKLCTRLMDLHYMLITFPMMAPLNAMGFYNILLVGVWLIACRKRLRGMLPVTLPGLATMIMVILGSTIANQDRYGFPIVYTMPLVLACLAYALQKARREQTA